MEIEEVTFLELGSNKLKQDPKDMAMTSSTVSVTSSLTSPVDSGVQLLDSESEMTSVMSVSGITEAGMELDCAEVKEKGNLECAESKENKEGINKEVMTKSDIVNQNVLPISASIPKNYFSKFESEARKFEKSLSDEVFEMEHPIKSLPGTRSFESKLQVPQPAETDLMNVSLTSYELLDYTMQNIKLTTENVVDQMHVSMSEEVNENLKVALAEPVSILPVVEEVVPKPSEDQIVFRRQRKKKSKSDTPKKRVSFHEDILNSTKIDDIHINHGFITHEDDVSLSFFQRGFVRKPDVVKGRYSWAAEGDAPYYEKPASDREIKSDLYIHQNRFSSTSSSSSMSSSIDEEDNNSSEDAVKSPPVLKEPKSSCLKKTNRSKKIDTNIVQEIPLKKKSESNLLDSNIFGSLKNILNFSTSVPLAERGVPEGQEDIHSASESNRRLSCTNLTFKGIETIVPKPGSDKTTLKLTTSEGFYPNYSPNQNLPANIVVCDSNVYEHKGISYSCEYDRFQKSFEQNKKPKTGSSVYQMILKEFSFFKRKAKKQTEVEEFEIVVPNEKPENLVEEVVEEPEFCSKSSVISNDSAATTTKMDWSDDTDNASSDQNSRHLNSPKRKIANKNHFSVQSSPFKSKVFDFPKPNSLISSNIVDITNKNLRPMSSSSASSSKTSLINRYLRNVTVKKMLDAKVQHRMKQCRRYMSLYVQKPKEFKVDRSVEAEFDGELAREIAKGRMAYQQNPESESRFDKKVVFQFKREIFRSSTEQLLRIFNVRSAYATNGTSRPLSVVLTNTTLYIAGTRLNNASYCNHFVLPYTELNTILIGPSGHTIHFSNYDKDMQCIITTGCSKITADLVGQLEIAMRRDANRPRLPAVKQLNMQDMVNLRRSICKHSSVESDEEYFFYGIVSVQDFNPEAAEVSPLGPNKEGPLMFKTDTGSHWETAYFILKAGVLYMLSSASQRVPLSVFPLINGSCQGARRIYNCPRPHTFQLIVEGRSLQLAAPDEYVASDWLQCLVHSASGGFNNQREKVLTQSCSLLMTNDHILTVREAFSCTISSLLPSSRNHHQPIKGSQVLSCAAIAHLTMFRLPSAEQSWCVLEFSCREVHEYSGDWILYFATNAELEHFISILEMLWVYNNEDGDSFPLSTIPETDPLSKKCVDVYTSLKNAWPSNTVHLQFL